MTVSRAAMAKETTAAVYALENLTIKVDGKQHAKVCCVCDAFIMYGDERSINVDNLKHKNVVEVLSKSWIDLLKEYGVPKNAETAIKCDYTLHCLPQTHEVLKNLSLLTKAI
jgi:hypothetical protein